MIAGLQDQKGSRKLGGAIKLQGVYSPVISEVKELSVVQLEKWIEGNEVWDMVVLQPGQEAIEFHLDSSVVGLVQEFSDVFEEPKQLPPQREYDHSIH